MSESANIREEGSGYAILFEWLDFDGDDCFRDFHIEIVNGTAIERFDFGDCSIGILQRSVRFFRGQFDKADFGFKFPDIRTYDLTRTEDGFSLEISLEAANRFEQFWIRKPTLTFADELLREYDADKT